MIGNVKSLSNVIKFHGSINIDFGISFLNAVYSFWVAVSSKFSKEIGIIDFTRATYIEFFNEFGAFFFWKLKTKIDKSPSEIIIVQLCASVIHSSKNPAKASKSNPWFCGHSSFEILANIFSINFSEIFDLSSIWSIWSSV